MNIDELNLTLMAAKFLLKRTHCTGKEEHRSEEKKKGKEKLASYCSWKDK
jgi:hypothetical protein